MHQKGRKKDILLSVFKKNFSKLSANFLVMTTKQQIRINYIEEISIKSGAKKINYYQICKKL